MASIIYSRVSTVQQNVIQQTEILKEHYPLAKMVFEDKASGKDLDRPELKKMMDYIRADDTLYIYDVSRLGRNTKDVLTVVEELTIKGVRIIVKTLGDLDISTPTGKLILTVMSGLAEMERENMLEKQAIGISRAQKDGKFKGKQKLQSNIDMCKQVFDEVNSNGVTVTHALSKVKVSRATYYKWLKDNK